MEAACRTSDGFEVRTTGETWQCDAIVAATGGSSEPRVPALASDLPQEVQQLTSLSYRRPAQIDDRGGVLVVGASASGVQIADELQRAGRDVTIAVGEHIRSATFVSRVRHLPVVGQDRPTRRAVGSGRGSPACPPACIGAGGRKR